MTPNETETDTARRILVLTPVGRDAVLTEQALKNAGLQAYLCTDMQRLCEGVTAGAAMALLTEDVINTQALGLLRDAIAKQPSWSDFPLVIFERPDVHRLERRVLPESLMSLGNVTILERPINVRTMLSAVRAAHRARQRQYDARAVMRQLEASIEERDQFLAMLGHELRNPMGAIRNAVDIITSGDRGGVALDRNVAIIDRQSRHLGRLIDDLVDGACLTRGKVSLEKRILDVRDVVDMALQQLTPVVTKQGLSTHLCTPRTPVFVDGDPVRLEQVVNNVLANAIKYTPAGGRIDITVETKGSKAVVRIADTGIGIDSEGLATVFDLFRQAAPGLARSKGGLGLGLTVVRTIMDMHGGSVSASSEGIGKGSTFILTLPLAPPAQTAPTQNHGDAATVQAPVTPKKILLIEDNEDNRETLQELLQMYGHEVDVAVDGPEGVQRALSLRPDIALVDIGLPGMDGYEVARQIRNQLGSKIFLIALTGYGQPGDRLRTAEAGFNLHLIKPAKIEELEAIFSQT